MTTSDPIRSLSSMPAARGTNPYARPLPAQPDPVSQMIDAVEPIAEIPTSVERIHGNADQIMSRGVDVRA